MTRDSLTRFTPAPTETFIFGFDTYSRLAQEAIDARNRVLQLKEISDHLAVATQIFQDISRSVGSPTNVFLRINRDINTTFNLLKTQGLDQRLQHYLSYPAPAPTASTWRTGPVIMT